MAITFQQQIKKQRNLIFIFLALVAVTLIIIWFGYFRIGEELEGEVLAPKKLKKIEIDLNTLKNPMLDELQPIEKIPSFEGEVGREDPFIPY